MNSAWRRMAGWLAGVWLLSGVALQAGDGGGALDFVREFLARYPKFQAEGTMTSFLPGRAPYRCRVEVIFDKSRSMLFAYNTDAAKNIIPYDYAFQNGKLRETIYNRERTEVKSSREVGAPTRTAFNFVWDLLGEAERGAGFHSLLFTGLMSIVREDLPKGTRIILTRRVPAGPVQEVRFSFDVEQRLKAIRILGVDGSASHQIDFRRFRATEKSSRQRE